MPDSFRRARVMFLCTGNSCRSQMAEGWARQLHPTLLDPCSAGTSPAELDPLAVRAMAEAGIDISAQRSKSIAACNPDALDLVVTVCDEASRQCPPAVGRARILRQGFDDPPRLAVGANSEEEAMTHYRRVRDEIRAFVATLPRLLDSKLFEGESSD